METGISLSKHEILQKIKKWGNPNAKTESGQPGEQKSGRNPAESAVQYGYEFREAGKSEPAAQRQKSGSGPEHGPIGGNRMKQSSRDSRSGNTKESAKFPSKKIKHDRQAESARAKFGLRGPEADQQK
jgi:hypothetical protein